MIVREAVLADVPALARVHVDTWRTAYRGIVPDAVLDSLSYEKRKQAWVRFLTGQGDPGFSYAAETEADEVVGFASGGPERDDDPEYTGELFAVYVHREHQGQGIGGALFRRVAGRLVEEGHRSMLVWCLAENPYRRFYERLGGRAVREKEVTIGDVRMPEIGFGWVDLRLLVEGRG